MEGDWFLYNATQKVMLIYRSTLEKKVFIRLE